MSIILDPGSEWLSRQTMADQKASLDLTHVLCEPSFPLVVSINHRTFSDDASSHVSLALALITLSPILLMVSRFPFDAVDQRSSDQHQLG